MQYLTPSPENLVQSKPCEGTPSLMLSGVINLVVNTPYSLKLPRLWLRILLYRA